MRMRDMRAYRRRLAIGLPLMAVAGGIVLWPLVGPAAQTPARAPAAAPPTPAATSPAPAVTPVTAGQGAEAPERTSAQFGDWSVNCAGRAPTRACEMVMAVRDQGRQLGAALAMGRVAREAPLRLVAQLPVNIRVSQPVRLVMEGAEPLALPFQTCNRLGCFAEIELREDAVRRLRALPAEQAGRLEWRDAAGQEMALPASFRGFAAAADALARETR
ncbi:invasion associated locus B family protein [Falsiroseomonas stagni]|uniref:Invasion protein IalB, involved in pathogenesis n=1 Tax=Falsiroseomonas stagni DSM 19981 TaxID=1123062 RepID=A0A1I4E2M4_9PROT|nr:invasion associated locus B family protein [Falsiroseomonas stagni]SFK99483.1 Invasion protein IalB, involved in pathogenesis [Falsiroseomonas stagni DSM 19981]